MWHVKMNDPWRYVTWKTPYEDIHAKSILLAPMYQLRNGLQDFLGNETNASPSIDTLTNVDIPSHGVFPLEGYLCWQQKMFRVRRRGMARKGKTKGTRWTSTDCGKQGQTG